MRSPRRRFVLLTYGSRGDVEPFVALARGLIAAGDTARLVGPGAYARLAEDHGVSYTPLPGDLDQMARLLAEARPNALGMARHMSRHLMPIAADVLGAVLAACREAEVVVHSFLMLEAGHLAARRQGLPDLSAQLFPVFLPTAAFPGVVFPDLPLGPAYRRTTHAVNTLIYRWGGRLLYRRLRAAHPDLPPLGRWPLARTVQPPVPLLFGFSPRVVPRPDDWPESAVVTGYWNLEPPPGWRPAEALVRFLEAGSPPVYFGVGSMRPSRLVQVVEDTARAILACGRRAVVAVPARLAKPARFPADVFVVDEVPHAWLFPRMAAVIHHGGAGTTGAALRAGVPSLAVPITADQSFWARRIHALGVGPPPTALPRWTARRAAEAIARLTGDPRMAEVARETGDGLRHEDGVGTAVDLIRARLTESSA